MNITKREMRSNAWRIRVEQKDEIKQRHFKYYTIKGNEEDADAFIEKLKIGKVRVDAPKNFEEYFTQWLQYRVADQQIRPASAHTYTMWSKTFLKHIGKFKLEQFNKNVLTDLYRTMLKDYPPSYVKSNSIILHKALKDALADGWIEHDPTIGVKTPKGKRNKKSTTLTINQMKELIDVTKTDDFYGPMIRFTLATGMRRGEVCALQVKDVDLVRSTVHVQHTCTYYDKGFHLGEPKSKTSHRTIVVPQEIKEELAVRIKNLQPNDFVFATAENKMMSPEILGANIRRILQSAGLNFTIHDLRHAHATHLLQQKMNVKAVSERLGHSDIKITLGLYTHVLPGDDELLADKINELF